MTPEIAARLAVDGLASGAIYVMIALGLVLIFTLTRVLFVPLGDIAAFAALTLAALEDKRLPGTAGLVIALAVAASLVELFSLIPSRRLREAPRALAYLIPPFLAVGASALALPFDPPAPARVGLAILMVLPIAPLLDRIVFRPIADASVLLLLIVAVALHFALAGVGLLVFGPEGAHTRPLLEGGFAIASVAVSFQTLLIVASAVVFCLALYLMLGFTLTGKALRAAINRTGARLIGLRPARAATLAYLTGSAMAAVSGVLIAPLDTIFYDSGFLLGLEAFIGAIIGGLVSFPVTALGALGVGLIGRFAAFQDSALKDVIVFAALIPVLIWRSALRRDYEDDVEE
jgi:branched-chain amino acid transport system permease protein